MREPGSGTAAPPAAPAREEPPAAPAAGGPPARRRWWRRWDPRWELAAFAELLAVCGLAITQPLLDVTGRSADFFLFSSAEPIDFVAMLLAATLPVPIALWALGALVGFAGRGARRLAHAVLVGAVLVFLMVVAGKRLTPLRGVPLAAAATVGGAALALAVARLELARQMLRLASVGPVVFVALFVFGSPAGAVLRHGDAAPVAVAATATSSSHPPVVVVLFDEFSLVSMMDGDGRIDAERFPNFAKLAAESTWYRNATAVSSYTPYAVPSILTGRPPFKVAAPFSIEYPENLFTLLAGTYDLKVQESISGLCPKTSCSSTRDLEPVGGSLRAVLRGAGGVVADILAPWDPAEDPTAGFEEPTQAGEAGSQSLTSRRRQTRVTPGFGFGNLKVNQPSRLTEFVAGLRPSSKPTLHFLHVLLPHTPYRHLASGTRYDPAPTRLEEMVGRGNVEDATSRWGLELLRERYEQQVVYTDALVGEMVSAMKERGLWDEALVVFTADHGVTFTPGYYKRDYLASTADILWVPTFVKEPGQTEGRIDDRNFEHTDLLPTIADWAGLSVPWKVDGVSQRGPARERQDKWYYPQPGQRVVVPRAPGFAEVLRGWGARAPRVDELVGRRVADFRAGDAGKAAIVDDPGRFLAVDPADRNVPAYVSGRLPYDMPDGTRVAIAVNGRIGAVAETARTRDSLLFAGLVRDESLFVAGRNQLELFVIGDGDGSLRRLGVTGAG